MATEKARSKVTLEGELMFPSDYIGAPDLKGRDAVLIISRVEKSELTMVGGRKKVKPVISFANAKKKLVCNSTNAQSIAFLYGNEAAAWVGKSITLYPAKTTFGKQTVDCVRIREVVPAPKGTTPPPAPAKPDPEDDDGSGRKFAGIVDILGVPPAPPINNKSVGDENAVPPDDMF